MASAAKPLPHRPAIFICCVLLIIFELLTCAAVSTKSPTFDEPIHVLAASVQMNSRDFRLDYDNPPLWKWWAGLPSLAAPLQIDANDPQWHRIPARLLEQWTFMIHTLYHAQNNPDALIKHSRRLMSLLAVVLGILLARWSWQLAGPIAAAAAAFLFAFDPNFIAHGALIKNDVTIALLFLALAFACEKLGRKITFIRVLSVGLLCGAGCSVKFSGVVLPIIAGLLIGLRAVMSPWPVGKRELRTPVSRFIAAVSLLIIVGLLTVLVIWASYGLRFSVSPDPAITIDTAKIISGIKAYQVGPDAPPGAWSPPPAVRLATWTLAHHLLPEPWCNGLLYIYASTQSRPAFLLGQTQRTGSWMIYALAIVTKTPLATLAAILLAIVAFPFIARKSPAHLPDRWAVYSLCLPPMIYALFVITSPSAAGLRHILVIYPFLFIGIAISIAACWNRAIVRWIISALAIGLIVETLCAFPNYISFFNLAAGGSRGGIRLLGDSNLDWGQDLPLLARWQEQHPDRKLYLSYFGTADPRHYGIHFTNLPGGELFGPTQPPTIPGVIAISATNLQAIFPAPGADLHQLYAPLRQAKPLAVLGGSIYLYSYP